MKLPLTEYGRKTEAPDLFLVPGLFGEGRNLAALARRLSDKRRVFTLDMRNHGAADWDDAHDYPAMAADLAETLAGYGDIDVMGHSMGGKALMTWLLSADELPLRHVIVADIAPVAYTHSYSDLIDAMLDVDLAQASGRKDVDRALEAAIPDAGLRGFLTHALEKGEDGLAWKHNLRALKANMDNIIGFPDSALAGRVYEKPVLFIAGETSDYISTPGKKTAKAYFPAAKFITLKGAGHWLHADAPKMTADTIAAYLAQ